MLFRIVTCAECVAGRAGLPEGSPQSSSNCFRVATETVTVSRESESSQFHVFVVRNAWQSDSAIRICGTAFSSWVALSYEKALITIRHFEVGAIPVESAPPLPSVGKQRLCGAKIVAMKLPKCLLRIHLFALGREFSGDIASRHPVMTWLHDEVS